MVQCFTIMASEVRGARIDPYFYEKDFLGIDSALSRNFKTEKLGELANFQYGLGETAQENGNIVYIRITDFDNHGELKRDSLVYLDYKSKYHDRKLQAGDILVARTGATFGKALFFDEKIDAVFAGYLIRILLKGNKILSKYLFYFMQTRIYWKQAFRLMTGGGQPQFNANTIKNLTIPLPPISVQQKIADMMDVAYKTKREKESEAKALLDGIDDYVLAELGITIPKIQEMMCWTVGSKDMQGGRMDVYYYRSQFEILDKMLKAGRFETQSLEYVFTKKELTKGILPKAKDKDGDAKVVQIKGITKDGFINTQECLTAKKEIFEEKHVLKKKDILIVVTGATIGKIGFWIDEDSGYYLGGDIVKFSCKNKISSLYIQSILRSWIGEIQIKKNITGATNGHLSPSDIKNIQIPLPDLTTQKRIASEVQSRMNRAKNLRAEAQKSVQDAREKLEKVLLG